MELYQYSVCGLNNIYLVNGYTIEEHDGEQYISFEDLEGLHKAIGLSIVKYDRSLSHREFRFLRKEIGLTQQQLASWLDVDVQSVGRWERGEVEIPGPADRLLRIIWMEDYMQGQKISEVLEELSEMDDVDVPPLNFLLEEDGWKSRIAA